MKTIYIISMFFVSLISYSQQANDLVFNEQINKIVTEREEVAPSVFQVKTEENEKTVNTSRKIVTQAYKDALALVETAIKDSVEVAQKKELIEKRHYEISEMKKQLKGFLESNDIYSLKKDMLVSAQKISSKYSLGYLLYADSQINTNFKSKFFVLSLDKMDLKIHLKRILWKMDSNDQSKKIELDNVIYNDDLQIARQRLRDTKRYEIIEDRSNVKSYDVFTLGSDVLNPEVEISGDFVNLGEFYVLAGGNGYKTDQLVSIEEVESKKITSEDFVFEISIVLIQNSITKSKYVISPTFIEQYAVNRIASQEIFKGKTSFPLKIYRNENDKVFDSLIFDYNKSRITPSDDLD